MTDIQHKWDTIYSENNQIGGAAKVLVNHRYLLPKTGRALDLACGLGSNAVLLADQGLSVEAWDISAVALKKLQQRADLLGLTLQTRQCPLTPNALSIAHYDVIIVSRFLDRSLCNAIMAALKPKGLLFYQTFTKDKLSKQGPGNPDYLLETNELLRLFAPLSLIYYQEYGRTGNIEVGNRDEALYIGQKQEPV